MVVQAEGTDNLRNKVRGQHFVKIMGVPYKQRSGQDQNVLQERDGGALDYQSGETSMDLREIYQKMISSLGNLDSNHSHSSLSSPWPMHFDSLLHLCILHHKSYLWGYHNSYLISNSHQFFSFYPCFIFCHSPYKEFSHLKIHVHLLIYQYSLQLFWKQDLTSLFTATAAAAKLLQSCPTLCDPIDGSPRGSPIPGILQTRTLEWVAVGSRYGRSHPWRGHEENTGQARPSQTPSMTRSRGKYLTGKAV